MALSKIVVPLDGSSLAEKALPAAAALARRADATVCLATVTGLTDADRRRADSEKYLAGAAESLLGQDYAACFHVVSGSPAQGIAEIALREKADLIVMTTRGRSGIARGILGSVTDAVIYEALAPVYVVRAETAPQTVREAGLPSGVIVPLDGSELAETAIDEAVQLARCYLSHIILLQALDEDAGQMELERARSYLERVKKQLAEQEIHAITEIVTGAAGEAIVKAMVERPDCPVVVSTRGASGLSRWVRGGVADWLIRYSPAPVVVVSPKRQALLGPAIH